MGLRASSGQAGMGNNWLVIYIIRRGDGSNGVVLTPVCLDVIKGLVINYGEGGYKMGNSRARNFVHPSSRQGKTLRDPLLESGKF